MLSLIEIKFVFIWTGVAANSVKASRHTDAQNLLFYTSSQPTTNMFAVKYRINVCYVMLLVMCL